MIDETNHTRPHYIGLATPSKTIKKLFRSGMHREMSLKDLAVNLIAYGTQEENDVASAWLANKERPEKVKKKRVPKAPKMETPKVLRTR